jgi:hypothetical protein
MLLELRFPRAPFVDRAILFLRGFVWGETNRCLELVPEYFHGSKINLRISRRKQSCPSLAYPLR